MPDHVEIERKFLVHGSRWREDGVTKGIRYRQGYLPTEGPVAVRARIGGSRAFLTIKGPRVGASRPEYEYEIPAADATEIIDTLCSGCVVEKTRYRLPQPDGLVWEIDEFHGANAGLVIAEIELESESQAFERPPWLGPEVTDDGRYANSQLAVNPWSNWGTEGGLEPPKSST